MSLAPEPGSRVRPRGRTWKVWQWYFAICMIAGGAIGFAAELNVALASVPAPLWLAASAAVVVFAMATTVFWMRDIDELAQRAHYVAWFWGGSTGLSALVFLVLASPALQRFVDFAAIERQLAPVAGEGAGFVAGVTASLLIVTLGYASWWLVFWLRKR